MNTEIQRTVASANEVSLGEQLAGKYMTFKLANEEYGLEILKVREIIGFMNVTRVPCTREFIRGVINLRGKVIPVVDLRIKFTMAACDPTDQTVIIVVQHQVVDKSVTVGILVDQVLEVLSIAADRSSRRPPWHQRECGFHLGRGQGRAKGDLSARDWSGAGRRRKDRLGGGRRF